ncbi:MAG: hypothetical protein JW892_05585 [Anaerolineae bacterium]|nr:hypothetical protein [Anaerolineae bacterium]
MVGMVPRDLECFLCQKTFTAVYGDFIVPEDVICDTCRAELAALTEDELRQTVTARLAQRGITDSKCIERVVQTLRQQRIEFAF